jgi:drug/metabolite transporter (DMT)-like permease
MVVASSSPAPGAPDPKLPRPATAAENLVGVLWMLASAVCFTVMVVLVKFLAGSQHEMVISFWRALMGMAVFIPFLFRREAWQVPRPGTMTLRAIYSAAGFMLSITAFANLPLAEAQSLSFTRTLFVALLAIFILKETVGIWRWSALGVGFLGVLVMMRPEALLAWDPANHEVTVMRLAALAASLFFGMAIITAKDMTRDHHPLTLVLWSNVLVVFFSLPFALPHLSIPSATDAGLLAVMGIAGVLAQTFYMKALAIGDASAVSPVDYVRLPLGAAAGVMLFKEVPDWLTWVGAGIVIASTLVITIREAIKRQTKGPTDS